MGAGAPVGPQQMEVRVMEVAAEGLHRQIPGIYPGFQMGTGE